MRDLLTQISEQLNQLFGENIGDESKIALAEQVSEKLRAMQQSKDYGR